MKIYYSVEDYKIYETESVSLIIIDGYAVNEDGSFPVLKLYVNGKNAEYSSVRIAMNDVIVRYQLKPEALMCGFRIVSSVQKKPSEIQLIGDETVLLSADEKKLKANTICSGIIYYIDHTYTDPEGRGSISGWVFSADGGPVECTIKNEAGEVIESKTRTYPRIDQPVFGKMIENRTGFQVNFKTHGNEVLCFDSGDFHDTFRFHGVSAQQADDGFIARMLKKVNSSSLERLKRYYRQHGLIETAKKVINTTRGIDAYHQWFQSQKTSEEELQRQKTVNFDYAPLISIVVPTFNTPEQYLHEMIESVRAQTYPIWQLCIADGSDPDGKTREILRKYTELDKRICVTCLDQNYGISGNTNKALELAGGEYTSLFDHDDLLEPDTLFEIVSSLQSVRHEVIYTDEDKLNSRSGRFESATFKPDFDLNLIRSENYITHFFTARTDLIREVGGFHSEFDGSQDFDLTLRCVEKAESVHHIPKVLYHWRMHEASTAEDPTSKLYCYESGEKALNAHFERTGVKAEAKFFRDPLWGAYKVTYECSHPRVSVILMNFDSEKEINECRTVLENGYDNIEFIVHGTDINEDVWMASGTYIVILDQCVSEDESALTSLIACCEQKDVGAVGGMVLDQNQLISHSCLLTGVKDGIADPFMGMMRSGPGYLNKAVVANECSALIPGAAVFRKKDWSMINGFDEAYVSGLFFADYCLKLRKQGKRIVYYPYSVWKENTYSSKLNESDLDLFRNTWKDTLEQVDPYYNPNFDREGGSYQI